jgi:membrane-associated phospholipid phosphatase
MDIILEFFQNIRNPILNAIFVLLTMSAEIPFIVFVTAILYWCVDKKSGRRILFALTGNVFLNFSIKEVVKAPRPTGTNPIWTETATGYSFPSGHTQNATTFWISLMDSIKSLYILGIIMILGVGISRMYLGVHFPIDVIFGWIFGLIFTLALLKIFDRIDNNKSYGLFIILLIIFGVITFLQNNIDCVKMFGLFSGFILGYIIEDKFIEFKTSSDIKGRINFGRKSRAFTQKHKLKINISRFLIGIISLGLVYFGLDYISNLMIENINVEKFIFVLEYIRYVIIVFYAVAVVPALFKKLKLDFY